MKKVVSVLKKAMEIIDRSVEIIAAFIFLIMVIVGAIQVSNRFIFGQSISWSAELQRFAHIWLIFLTIPVAYNRGSHIGMGILMKKLPPGVHRIFSIVIDAMWLVLASAIIIYTDDIMRVASSQTSAGLGVGMNWIYLGIMVGGIYLGIIAIRKLIEHINFLRKPDKGD